MSYPLINVFPKFLSVTAIPEKVGKGFGKFPEERTGVCLFSVDFKEEVVCCYSSVEERELEHSKRNT